MDHRTETVRPIYPFTEGGSSASAEVGPVKDSAIREEGTDELKMRKRDAPGSLDDHRRQLELRLKLI